MDFSNFDIKIINPIAPITNNNKKQKDEKQKSRLKQFYKITDKQDTYTPSDSFVPSTPNSLYNAKGQIYANSNFYKHLTAELNKIINLDEPDKIEDARTEVKGPEYARTFLVLEDLPQDNRFKYLFDDSKIIDKTVNNLDIRTTLPYTPCYMSDSSYSVYVNQNPNSEMYQQTVNNQPKQVIHNIKDYTEKYFQPTEYTSFKEHKI